MFRRVYKAYYHIYDLISAQYGERAAYTANEFFKFFLRALLVVFFYIIGVIFYTNIEHFSITDAAFFITVTVTTVGYGLFHPDTQRGRIFTCFYAGVGIALVLSEGNALSHYFIKTFQEKYLASLNLSPQKKRMYRVLLSIGIILGIIILGTGVFAYLETWTVDLAFYFTMITIYTIGYGDVDITNENTRKFAVFFILFCVVGFATAINNFIDAVQDIRQDKFQQIVLKNISQASSMAATHSRSAAKAVSSPTRSSLTAAQSEGQSDDENDHSDTPLGPTSSSSPRRSLALPTTDPAPLEDIFDLFFLHFSSDSTTARQLSVAGALATARERPSTPGTVGTIALLEEWTAMSEERFVLDMLLRLDTISKEKHIDPWLEFHRQLKRVNESRSEGL